MTECRNSTDSGCRCPEHHPGLLAFAINDQHRASLNAALDRVRETEPAVLRVLTFDPLPPNDLVTIPVVACDGSYCCPCRDCERDRARRIRQGVRVSQPLPMKTRRAA